MAQKWAKYKLNLGNRQLRSLRGSAGFYSHWDDHEFINDFSPRENTFETSSGITDEHQRRGALPPRRAAFRDYAPVSYSPRAGIYRSVRWGANLELFFLDQRSFRDAKADEGGVCDNPQTGQPDVAPTAPQRDCATSSARSFPSSGLSASRCRQHAWPRFATPTATTSATPSTGASPCHQQLDGALQGDHERAADPAVLRAPL